MANEQRTVFSGHLFGLLVGVYLFAPRSAINDTRTFRL